MDKKTSANKGDILANVGIIAKLTSQTPTFYKSPNLKPSLPEAIELEGKRAFLLIGSATQITIQLAVLRSIYAGDIAYCAFPIGAEKEQKKALEEMGATVFAEPSELFNLAKNYVEQGVKCVALTYFASSSPQFAFFDLGSLPIPFLEFRDKLFPKSAHLDSVEPWMMPLLNEIFHSGNYAGPFHFETTVENPDSISGILSCAKKLESGTFVSVPERLISTVFGNNNPEVSSICDWEIAPDAPITSETIFIGEYFSDDEAYAEIERLASLSVKPKIAYIVVRQGAILPFYEELLSEKVGFPIKTFNPLSPLYCGIDEFYEDWKKRTLFNCYICHTQSSYFPFLEKDINSYKAKEARKFDSLTSYCPYSIYVYRDAYEGKQEKDLLGKSKLKVFDAIKRGESIPPEWFYSDFIKTFGDPDSLLYRFADHEHIMWARRTCLYRNKEDFAKKKIYFKPLSKFLKLLGDKANAQIVKDYYASIPFLFEVISPKRRHFDPKMDLAAKPIDLDKLVAETDISGKQLEDIIVSYEPEEISLAWPRFIELEKINQVDEKPFAPKTPTGMSNLLCGEIEPENFPKPGDILTDCGKKLYVVLYAYEVSNMGSWPDNIEELTGVSLRPETQRDVSTIIGVALVNLLIPPHGKEGQLKNLPLLYGAPYRLGSASGVLLRKRVSDALKIGELGQKAFQTPIISKIPLKKAPFTIGFDVHSLFSYRMVFASSIDDYRSGGAEVNEDIFRLVKSFKLPKAEFPYLGYEQQYSDDNLSLRSVPIIDDPDDPDRDEDDDFAVPNVLTLPHPVLHRSMLPILASMLYLEEEDGFALGEGKLLFDKKALDEHRIAFTKNPSEGVELYKALPLVFAILKDPHGEMMERALREFARYPFGEKKQRMLLYRLAKLGVFNEKAFFHSYIPVSNVALSKLFFPGTGPDIYMLSIINTAADILKMEYNGKNDELEKSLEKHANECFDCLLFAHLRTVSKVKITKQTPDEIRCSLYESWLKCDGTESRADIADALLGARSVWYLDPQSDGSVLTYLALFAQYVSRDKFIGFYESDPNGKYVKLQELSNKYACLLSLDSNGISSWRLGNYVEKLGPDTYPKSLRLALPGREEAEFDVLAGVSLLRREYLVVSPKENLGYMTPKSCLVLVKNQFDGSYSLETLPDTIDVIIESFD